jgi:hypothetical protein
MVDEMARFWEGLWGRDSKGIDNIEEALRAAEEEAGQQRRLWAPVAPAELRAAISTVPRGTDFGHDFAQPCLLRGLADREAQELLEILSLVEELHRWMLPQGGREPFGQSIEMKQRMSSTRQMACTLGEPCWT